MLRHQREVFVLIVLLSLLAQAHGPDDHGAADSTEPEEHDHLQFLDSPSGLEEETTFASAWRLGEETGVLTVQKLLREGEVYGRGQFGVLQDVRGRPLRDGQGNPATCGGIDYTSLLHDGRGWSMVSHAECVPGAIYQSSLTRSTDGLFTTKSTEAIWGGEDGLWLPCAGDITPQGTLLSTEEFEPDASRSPEEVTGAMRQYSGRDLTPSDLYKWGWVPEITVGRTPKKSTYERHYSLGRFSHEVPLLLPDQRSVLLTDDQTNGALFLFVSDEPGSLSSGTLYASKWTQTPGESFHLNWISLGQVDGGQISTAITGGITFGDLFTKEAPQDGQCAAGATPVVTSFGAECLTLQPGKEALASRLESRRYAAMLGATTELRKVEGAVYDPDNHKIYLAISEISKGMTAGHPQWDHPSADHIQLEENLCGGVMTLSFPSKFSLTPNKAEWLIKGVPLGDLCAPGTVANPDNLAYLPDHQLLTIAEDSGRHDHNLLWAYDVKHGELAAIASAAEGAEWSGIRWYPDVEGFGYLTVSFQRSMSYWDGEKGGTMTRLSPEERSWTGLIGPFPKLSEPEEELVAAPPQ